VVWLGGSTLTGLALGPRLLALGSSAPVVAVGQGAAVLVASAVLLPGVATVNDAITGPDRHPVAGAVLENPPALERTPADVDPVPIFPGLPPVAASVPVAEEIEPGGTTAPPAVRPQVPALFLPPTTTTTTPPPESSTEEDLPGNGRRRRTRAHGSPDHARSSLQA
jgi:hypothetical protein